MSQPSHTSSDQFDDRYSEPHSNANSSQVENTSVDQQFDFDDAQLTLRALVSTKEAGVIIGKGSFAFSSFLSCMKPIELNLVLKKQLARMWLS